MTFPTLRPFQVATEAQLRQGFAENRKNQVVMAATGAGKTLIGLKICADAIAKGRRAAFVCDRIPLIEQTSQRCDEYGIPHGVIQADHWRNDPSCPMQVCSVQTVAARGWPDADVIVQDECHVQYKTWTEHALSARAAVIGLSATPFSRGLGRVFQGLVNATTMDALTREGVLVPMRVMSCKHPDMRGATTVGGEWSNKSAAAREIVIIGDVVSEWIKHASDRKTVVFGATIAHCESMAEEFRAQGVHAEVYCARTVQTARDEMLVEFRKPDSSIRVLLSVEALAKGLDVPDISCICDCRPLRKSLSAAMQMWGRGLRCSPETGKTDCLLLDFSGNIVRFADDFTNVYFNGLDRLDDGERLDREVRAHDDDEEKSPKACPKCGAIPFTGHCMQCGFQAHNESSVIALPGTLRDLDLGTTHHVLREEVTVSRYSRQSPVSIYRQCMRYAVDHSAPDRQRGRAAHLFKEIVGMWPLREYAQIAPSETITSAVMGRIRQSNIAYAKSRKRA